MSNNNDSPVCLSSNNFCKCRFWLLANFLVLCFDIMLTLHQLSIAGVGSKDLLIQTHQLPIDLPSDLLLQHAPHHNKDIHNKTIRCKQVKLALDRFMSSQQSSSSSSPPPPSSLSSFLSSFSSSSTDGAATAECALLFFGLPRSFESLTLPSIIKNVLHTNPMCDVYVHFYQQTQESPGRSGQGGIVHPDEIYLLQHFVKKDIYYYEEPEYKFWNKYQDLLQTIHTVKNNQDGRPLYFPWKAKTYSRQTVDNIIKMWHSIESVWTMMENTTKLEGSPHKQYKTVAMLRSDVVYRTPLYLDEYYFPNHNDNSSNDSKNKISNASHHHINRVVVPGFGLYPVSDRLIYGHPNAVRIWATGRFKNIEQHVDYIAKNHPGWGLHEERFLEYTIFPMIEHELKSLATTTKNNSNNETVRTLHHNITQNNETSSSGIVQHPTLCFLRARADEHVWITDCHRNSLPSIREGIGHQMANVTQKLEETLGRHCPGRKPKKMKSGVQSLDCSCQ